ncbi:MAG: FAD-dependent oxidoreductase, partial [Brachybacterium sp.]
MPATPPGDPLDARGMTPRTPTPPQAPRQDATMPSPGQTAPELTERAADLVVIGGGLGGVAASLTAARLGLKVLLTEADPWLGGQLTVQGVP